MKLKPVKWRKNNHWQEAKAGMFGMSADENMFSIWVSDGMYCVYLVERKCRSVSEGKRKAEAWLRKQIERVAE